MALIALGGISSVAFRAHNRDARRMPDSAADSALVRDAGSVPESPGAPRADGAIGAAPGAESAGLAPTPAGLAALEAARALARQAAAPATLRAYWADWAHYAAWCAEKAFTPVVELPSAFQLDPLALQ
jgi:hypothetical protein